MKNYSIYKEKQLGKCERRMSLQRRKKKLCDASIRRLGVTGIAEVRNTRRLGNSWTEKQEANIW